MNGNGDGVVEVPKGKDDGACPFTGIVEQHVYVDNKGRQMIELRPRDGSPSMWRGVGMIEVGQINFPIEGAASVETAFELLDPAFAIAAPKAREQMQQAMEAKQRQQPRITLPGQLPPPLGGKDRFRQRGL